MVEAVGWVSQVLFTTAGAVFFCVSTVVAVELVRMLRATRHQISANQAKADELIEDIHHLNQLINREFRFSREEVM